MAEEGWLDRLFGWVNSDAGRWAAGAVVAGMVVLAAVAIFRGGGGRKADEIRARGHTVYYVCKACGATGRTVKPYEQPFPIECPQCGRGEAVEGFRCVQCRRIIENQTGQAVFFCPHPDCRFKYNRRVVGD